jgi:hypothetical protein
MKTITTLTLLALLGLGAAAQDLVATPGRTMRDGGETRTMARLRHTSLNVSWIDRSLEDCVRDLRARTGINFLLSGGARAAEFEVAALELRRVSPLLLVQLLAEESGLVARFGRGLVIFETMEESVRRTATLAIYDLASRFYEPPDYPAPRIGIRPTIEEDFEDEIRPEPRDFQEIVDILQSATGEGNWEIEGCSMQIAGKRLIVRHTPAMQRRVARLLDALSAFH